MNQECFNGDGLHPKKPTKECKHENKYFEKDNKLDIQGNSTYLEKHEVITTYCADCGKMLKQIQIYD